MIQIFHILKYKLKIFLKSNSEVRVSSLLKNIGSAFVYILFGLGVYFFIKSSLSYLLEEIRIGNFLLHRFISIILFIFFLAVNAGNIIVSFSTLYKSKEVFYLITKPISFTKIFLIKFLDNFFYSSTTMLLMISAVMVAYCTYFKLDFVVAVSFFFLLLIPFMLTAASLGVIILMLMILASYKIGLKKVIAGIVLIYLIGLVLFFQASNPISIVEQVMALYPNVNNYFDSLDNRFLRFLPNFWIADSLYWIANNNWSKALPYIGLLNSTALICLSTAIISAKKLYYKTWVQSFELKFKNSDPIAVSKESKAVGSHIFLTPQIDALIKKEYLQFFREPGQWIHLSILVFLIIVFIISLAGIDADLILAYNFGLRAIIYLTIFSFNLFLISSLAIRFVFPAISLESDAFWKLKSSPIPLKKIVSTKFCLLFTLIFLLGQVINYFSHLSFPRELYLTSSLNMGFITLAIVSLNFGMGSLFINLKEKSPIRIASSQGASLTFLFTIILIVFLIAVLFIPIYNYYNDIFGFQERLKSIYISSIIIAVFSIVVFLISIELMKRALNRDF